MVEQEGRREIQCEGEEKWDRRSERRRGTKMGKQVKKEVCSFTESCRELEKRSDGRRGERGVEGFRCVRGQ